MKTEKGWFLKTHICIIAYIDIEMNSDDIESDIKVIQDTILTR